MQADHSSDESGVCTCSTVFVLVYACCCVTNKSMTLPPVLGEPMQPGPLSSLNRARSTTTIKCEHTLAIPATADRKRAAVLHCIAHCYSCMHPHGDPVKLQSRCCGRCRTDPPPSIALDAAVDEAHEGHGGEEADGGEHEEEGVADDAHVAIVAAELHEAVKARARDVEVEAVRVHE